jgi:hypothetical protein
MSFISFLRKWSPLQRLEAPLKNATSRGLRRIHTAEPGNASRRIERNALLIPKPLLKRYHCLKKYQYQQKYEEKTDDHVAPIRVSIEIETVTETS